MSRIPLSDESDIEVDDEIIADEVGTIGAEEHYAELDFAEDDSREYEPDAFDDEDAFYDPQFDDSEASLPWD